RVFLAVAFVRFQFGMPFVTVEQLLGKDERHVAEAQMLPVLHNGFANGLVVDKRAVSATEIGHANSRSADGNLRVPPGYRGRVDNDVAFGRPAQKRNHVAQYEPRWRNRRGSPLDNKNRGHVSPNRQLPSFWRCVQNTLFRRLTQE